MSLLRIPRILALILTLTLLPLGAAFAQESETDAPAAEDSQSLGVMADVKKTASDDLKFILLPLPVEELSTLAGDWQALVINDLSEAAKVNLALKNSTDSDTTALRADLDSRTSALTDVLSKYDSILDSWTSKGGNADEIKIHTDYLQAVALGTLRTTDPSTLARRAGEWIVSMDGGLRILIIVAAGIFAFAVLRMVAKTIQKLVYRKINLVPNISHLLRSFITTLVYWAVIVVGVIVVLGVFGVNVTPLFAVLGGLSFILAFALQDTLGNFASGLMIMILKPFDTGDYIKTSGEEGTVDDVSIVSTRLRTIDNKIIVLPNSKIWGDVITNVSASSTRRVDMVFGIGYSDSAQKAIEVLQGLVKAHPNCLSDPAPEIFVGELGDSSVNIFCRVWSKSDDYWTVHWDLMGRAKDAFDAEGISIPFPQRDVHIISE